MQKKFQEKIPLGGFRVKKSHIRRQGQTIRKEKESVVKIFPKLAGAVALVVMIAVAFLVGIGINSHTTYNRKFFSRGIGTVSAETKHHAYKAMAAIETSSGRLLAGYHEEERLPMASTTKIATAIVTIEKMQDLTQKFEVPAAAVGVEGSSMYLKHGEVLSLEEYLYGLMLPSGNDAAVALAHIVSGGEEEFAALLNEFATKLGLLNTHFVTASGLHDENHYTSSHDLAKITAYAMKNEKFREIVGTKQITVTGEAPDKPRHLKNKQKLMQDESLIKEDICVTGVKSGFTPEAGRCLVTSAQRDGMEVVVVVLNAPEMFESTADILKEIFEDYKMVTLLAPKQHITKVPVVGSKTEDINIYSESGLSYPLTKEEESVVKICYQYDPIFSAPIQKDQEVGSVSVKLYDEVIFSTPIRALQSAAKEDLANIITNLIKSF